MAHNQVNILFRVITKYRVIMTTYQVKTLLRVVAKTGNQVNILIWVVAKNW
jgi:hypothetical protein